jgi:hypothetical protein
MKSMLILFSILVSLSAFSNELVLPPETTIAEATELGSCVLNLRRDVQIKKNHLYANVNNFRTIIAMKNVDPDNVRRLKAGRQIILYRAFDKIDFKKSSILFVEDEAVHSIKIQALTLEELNEEGTFEINCQESIPVDV